LRTISRPNVNLPSSSALLIFQHQAARCGIQGTSSNYQRFQTPPELIQHFTQAMPSCKVKANVDVLITVLFELSLQCQPPILFSMQKLEIKLQKKVK